MSTLIQFGWNDFHQKYFDQYPQKDLSPGRVVSIKGFRYEVVAEKGVIETELSGKLLYANSPDELPKVGDWVMFMDYASMGYIIDVFPRTNLLSRKNPGEKTEMQVLAANIDAALVVQGLDRDFNLMRIERYLVQIISCGIRPVVILNKADLVTDPQSFKEEVLKLGRDCEVHCCSTYTGDGLQVISGKLLAPCKTYIMIGSSGVGKSSLLNYLLEEEMQKTGGMSDSTSKGKHTTTTRDLVRLKNNSLLIDTPGMREFGLTAASGQGEELFPAIQKFSEKCRYSDCTHMGESDCAVVNALNSGELDAMLYESYVKLLKEQRRFEIRIEDKKRLGKQWGKMTKEAKAYRKKYKY